MCQCFQPEFRKRRYRFGEKLRYTMENSKFPSKNKKNAEYMCNAIYT